MEIKIGLKKSMLYFVFLQILLLPAVLTEKAETGELTDPNYSYTQSSIRLRSDNNYLLNQPALNSIDITTNYGNNNLNAVPNFNFPNSNFAAQLNFANFNTYSFIPTSNHFTSLIPS